jgi:hypothetical protein
VDPTVETNTLTDIVQGLAKVFAGGESSIITLGVVSVVVAIVGWYFKAEIAAFLKKIAATITAAAANAQSQQSNQDNQNQENQVTAAQNQLANFADSEQKTMLDALSYSDLIKYATTAYGAGAVTGVLQQAASQDAARVGLYLLYGLQQKGS